MRKKSKMVAHHRLARRDELLTKTANFLQKAQFEVEETYKFEVTEQIIKVNELPEEFEDFRIVQMSDIHHSPYLRTEHIAEAVKICNSLEPDIVALTGDYITHTAHYIDPCVDELARLEAKNGVFAVLGNHDVWVNARTVTRSFEKRHIEVLTNVNTEIVRKAEHIRICGIGDMMMHHHNLPAALKGTTLHDTRVLLSHNPDIIEAASYAKIDLVLAGHTHGGQFHLPFIGAPMAFSRYGKRFVQGLAEMKQTQIYVNRGLGTVVVPVRFRCPPEITLLRLVRAPEEVET